MNDRGLVNTIHRKFVSGQIYKLSYFFWDF